MKKENYIQIILLIVIFLIYHQEAFLNQVLKFIIVIAYSLFAIYFSMLNFLNKKNGKKIKVISYYITGAFEFLWFLTGFFVLYRNIKIIQ